MSQEGLFHFQAIALAYWFFAALDFSSIFERFPFDESGSFGLRGSYREK